MSVTISSLPAATVPYDAGTLFEMSVPDSGSSSGYTSKKGVLADLVAGTLVAPVVNITGTWDQQPTYHVVAAFGLAAARQDIFVTSEGGVTLGELNSLYTGMGSTVLGIDWTNITGVGGDVAVQGAALADFSAAMLKVVNGTLSITAADDSNTVFDLSALELVASSLTLGGFTNLTALSLPALRYVNDGMTLSGFDSVETISLPELEYLGGSLALTFPTMTSFDVSSLVEVAGIDLGGAAALTAASFPALVTCTSDIAIGPAAALTTVSFPVLETMPIGAGFTVRAIPLVTTLSFPALTIMGELQADSATVDGVTTITLPVLERWKGCVIGVGLTNLTTFTLGASLKFVNASKGVTFTTSPLNQASVDNILVRLAALDGTNGTTSFDNADVELSGPAAAPSATGLAAKATLEGRGCTVTVN